MSLSNTYHGHQTPEQYKQGERTYWFLKNQLQEWGHVIVGFSWPDQASNQWEPVLAPVEAVYRERGTPYARLRYLEYDSASRAIVKLVTQGMEAPDDKGEQQTLEYFNKLLRQVGRGLQSVDMQTELGLIPEGLCVDNEVAINLTSFALHSLQVSNPKVALLPPA